MDEVAKILPSLFRKQMRRDEPYLLEILLPFWPRIAGKAIAQHCQPAYFSGGVLTLNADCATWGTQLRQMAEEFRARINGYLGQPVVKKLRIKTVAAASLFALPAVAGKTISRLSPLAGKAVDTSSIADPEVAATLANSYAKYFTRRAGEN